MARSKLEASSPSILSLLGPRGARIAALAFGLGSFLAAAIVALALLDQLAPAGQSIDDVRALAVRAVALVTFGALVVGFLLARWYFVPLRRLVQSAESLAAGGTGVMPPAGMPDGPEDLARLAVALGSLCARLNATTRDASAERGTLAAVLAGMDDGVLLIEPDGRVALANPAAERILGISDGADDLAKRRTYVEMLRDHELVQFVRSGLTASVGPNGSTAAPTGATRLMDVGFYRLFLRVQVAPLGEGRGLVVLQDLTEIRRAETVRRDFVANVSHELRTPLASLKALVETLQDGALEEPEVARDFLGRMDVEIDGLTQLVRELLELSRIESGRLTMRKEPVKVADLLDRAADRLRAQADRAGLALTVAASTDLPPVPADAERLMQTLINLIHNAIKFTPPGGEIRVAAQGGRQKSDGGFELLPPDGAGPSPTHVILSVADTGVGISPEDQPRIFERFYKADKARTGGGTGLGLAIVKHVAEAHGGKVWVESRPDEGATFRIALPLRSWR